MTYVNQRMIGLIDMKEESGPKKSRYSYTPTFWPVVLYLWPKLHQKCHKLHRRLYFLAKLNSSPCWIEAALPFEGFMFFVFDILWSVTNTKYFYFCPFALSFVLSPSLSQSSVLLGWGYGYGESFVLVFYSCPLFLSFVLVFCLLFCLIYSLGPNTP